MKVIKIEKTYRGGKKINHLIVYNKEEDINSMVEDWCMEDLNGANYGYSWKWEEEKDPEVIDRVVLNEINNISTKINVMESRHKKLIGFIGDRKQY